MNVATVHYRFLYALVVLGVVAYSIAEEDLAYAAIAAPIALAAWVLVGPSSPPVPRWLINGALIAVTAHMLFSWAGDIGDTIGVLCRYVTWLQLIKLFEPRAPRDQAQIVMLSMVLVIGACLTSVTISLGAVLLLYLPVLIVTVMLFQVHSSLARAGLESTVRAGRSASRQFGALGVVVTCAMLLLAVTVFVVVPRGAGEGLLGRWKPPETDPVTGFRDHVQLGAEGLLSESRRIVMEMTVDPPANDQGARGRAHLLRGAVLDTYDRRRGLWQRGFKTIEADLKYAVLRPRPEGSEPFRDGFILRPEQAAEPTAGLDPELGPYTVFRITILDERPERLFAKWRPVALDLKLPEQRVARVMRGATDGELTIRTSEAPFSYAVVASPNAPPRLADAPPDTPSKQSSAPDTGSSASSATPAPSPSFVPPASAPSTSPGPDGAPLLRPARETRANSTPTNPFETGPVRELAERILADARLNLADGERDTRTRAASAFQSHLQKNYAYTMQMIAPADGQDPIEMFLFDGERGGRGHCEYFASAMAALCRSVGIPARLVAGYAASEFDAGTGLYTIRDNHAHAWTEVETRPGHWVEFDPSPAAEIARLHQPPGGWTAAYRRLMSTLQIAWAERFIGYDRSSQSTALQSLGASPFSLVASLNEWVQDQINGRHAQQASRRAAAAEAAQAFAFVLLLATLSTMGILASIAIWRRLVRRWRQARRIEHSEAPPDPASRAQARLYGAMLATLSRAGRPKPAWVPPLQHARTLAAVDPELAAAAERLTGRFYESRYGRRPPSVVELEESRGLLALIRERSSRLARAAGPVRS